jgi:hypothetical protein
VGTSGVPLYRLMLGVVSEDVAGQGIDGVFLSCICLVVSVFLFSCCMSVTMLFKSILGRFPATSIELFLANICS